MAFTLAEVLITLTIIGVIAALTIPNLMKKYENQQTISALTKVQSELNYAYKMAEKEYGDPTQWDLKCSDAGDQTLECNKTLLEKLAPYLKISDKCLGNTGSKNCFSENKYKDLNGNSYSNNRYNATSAMIKLMDNSAIQFQVWQKDCDYYGTDICGFIPVDINAKKAPNRFGYDTFAFYLTKSGIIPAGLPKHNDTNLAFGYLSHKKYCNITTKFDTAYGNGLNCTAWILLKKNLDYQKKVVNW